MCDALAASHDELDITVEDAGATLDRLAALDDAEPVPLWITLDPFPTMVDALRQSDPIGFESQALGSSQLAIAFRAGEKATAIATFCESDTTPLWRCLGEQAGADWSTFGTSSISGTLRPSLGDVTNSALGLTSFASTVASYFGAVDVDRAQFDDTSFISWLRRLSPRVARLDRGGHHPAGQARRPSGSRRGRDRDVRGEHAGCHRRPIRGQLL